MAGFGADQGHEKGRIRFTRTAALLEKIKPLRHTPGRRNPPCGLSRAAQMTSPCRRNRGRHLAQRCGQPPGCRVQQRVLLLQCQRRPLICGFDLVLDRFIAALHESFLQLQPQFKDGYLPLCFGEFFCVSWCMAHICFVYLKHLAGCPPLNDSVLAPCADMHGSYTSSALHIYYPHGLLAFNHASRQQCCTFSRLTFSLHLRRADQCQPLIA